MLPVDLTRSFMENKISIAKVRYLYNSTGESFTQKSRGGKEPIQEINL